MSGYQELPSTGPTGETPKQSRVLPGVTAALVLAVVQVALGLVLLSLGCVVAASHSTSVIRATGVGIWIGVWVCIAGFVGGNPSNSCLSSVYRAMNIITTIAEVAAGAMLASGSAFDSHACWSGGDCFGSRRVHGALIVLAAIEWFVALAAAILSCNRGCCGTQRGTVLLQPGVIARSGADILIISHTNIGMLGQDPPPPSYAEQQPYPVTHLHTTSMAGQMPAPPPYTYPGQQPYSIARPTNTDMVGLMPAQASYGSPTQQTCTISQSYGTGPPVPTNYHDNDAPGSPQTTFPATAQSSFLPSQSNVSSTQQPANYHHSQPATWTTFSAPAPPGHFPFQPTASNTHPQANYPQIPAWSTTSMTGNPGGMAPPPYNR